MGIYNNQAIALVPAAGFPTFILAGQTWSSGAIANDGYGAIVAALTASQACVIKITRYMDSELIVPLTSASQTLTASTAGNCVLSDACPALYFAVTVNNPTGTTATTTGWGLAVGGT